MNRLIFKGYIPGVIGRIVELHARYYHQHWGFGLFFEAKVALEMAEFFSRFDEDRDGFWYVQKNGQIEGSVAIDGINAKREGAHLRWFILSPAIQGQGFGQKLIKKAIDFCKQKKYDSIYLWTFDGLNIARHIYEKYGFKLVKQNRGTRWGVRLNEQRFELRL